MLVPVHQRADQAPDDASIKDDPSLPELEYIQQAVDRVGMCDDEQQSRTMNPPDISQMASSNTVSGSSFSAAPGRDRQRGDAGQQHRRSEAGKLESQSRNLEKNPSHQRRPSLAGTIGRARMTTNVPAIKISFLSPLQTLLSDLHKDVQEDRQIHGKHGQPDRGPPLVDFINFQRKQRSCHDHGQIFRPGFEQDQARPLDHVEQRIKERSDAHSP